MGQSYNKKKEWPELDKATDEEVLKISQKEPAVFQILVERYEQPLFRAAWRVVRSKEEAEDIVQEAFLKIYKNAGRFRKLEGIKFSSWAYKIAINTAITHYRKLQRREFLSEDPTALNINNKERREETFSAEAADAKALVAKILNKMPVYLKSVLEKYYLQDQSYKNIAHEEGISIPTLKMRLFRAKKIFKKLMDEEK